jgi:hypothetical protein
MHRGNASRQNEDSDINEAHRNKKQEMKTHTSIKLTATRARYIEIYTKRKKQVP